MFDLKSFIKFCDEIEALGYDPATAAHYAALIGDTPCLDEQGRVIVEEDDGTELARLNLGFDPPDLPEATIEGDAFQMPYADLAKVPEAEFKRLNDYGRLGHDALKRSQEIADAYEGLFGNFGEIALPEFLVERQFEDLLLLAIRRGQPLTRDEVSGGLK